jgi:hypothetical protein
VTCEKMGWLLFIFAGKRPCVRNLLARSDGWERPCAEGVTCGKMGWLLFVFAGKTAVCTPTIPCYNLLRFGRGRVKRKPLPPQLARDIRTKLAQLPGQTQERISSLFTLMQSVFCKKRPSPPPARALLLWVVGQSG